MRAFGAELIEHGHDFHDADAHGDELAASRKLHRVLSFHPLLVRGVASYALELFQALPDLDLVYVPTGWGPAQPGWRGAERSGTENEDYCSRLQ